jgi:hypothetical protein
MVLTTHAKRLTRFHPALLAQVIANGKKKALDAWAASGGMPLIKQ